MINLTVECIDKILSIIEDAENIFRSNTNVMQDLIILFNSYNQEDKSYLLNYVELLVNTEDEIIKCDYTELRNVISNLSLSNSNLISEATILEDGYKPVYILLTKTNTTMSKLITGYTGDRFSHVSIGFDPSMKKVYSFGRKDVTSPMTFSEENIFDGVYKAMKDTTYSLYCIFVDNDVYRRLQEKIEEFKNTPGLKFNYLGFLGIMMDKPIERDGRMFCSEFVSRVMKESGIDIFKKPTALMRPYDFAKMKDLFFVSKGKLNRYNEKNTVDKIQSIKKQSILKESCNEVKAFSIQSVNTLSETYTNNLFHLSKSNLNGHILKPRVPDNYMTKNGYEDASTPRVSFSSSIDGCLVGMSMNLKGVEMYVHVPIDNNISIKKPTINQVPDVKLTDEVWVLDDVKVKCVGKIKVDAVIDRPLEYSYGNKTAQTFKWSWHNVQSISESSTALPGKSPIHVNIDAQGDIIIEKKEKIDFMEAYMLSHKLLKMYEQTHNYDGMKYELAKLWYMIIIIENRIIYNKSKIREYLITDEKKKEAIKARSFILNDFSKYTKIVLENEPEFNFDLYYTLTKFGVSSYKIDQSTLLGIKKTIKTLIV